MSRGRRKPPSGPAPVIALRPRPRVEDLHVERFEFVDGYRGVMARLAWGRSEVLCTEWPGTLLAMLRADVLGPDAREEAEFLNAEMAAPSPNPSPEPWVPPAIRCGVPGCGWPGTSCPHHPKAKRTVAPPIQPHDEEAAWRAGVAYDDEPDRLISTETRRANVLAFLMAHVNHWVPGPEIADPAVGGSEGLRRVRELREARFGGHTIEVRRMSGSDAYEYRLVEGAE